MKVKFGLGTGSSVKPFDLHYEQWFSQGVKGVNVSAAVIDLGSERQGALRALSSAICPVWETLVPGHEEMQTVERQHLSFELSI